MATQPISPSFPPGGHASAQAGARTYRPALDALRFFAFLSVLLHHTDMASPNGPVGRYTALLHFVQLTQEIFGFGLCLFFFLSSFLITSLLQVEKKRTGSVDLRKFYIRRILRIWPLYFLFLGAMFLLGLAWKTESIGLMRMVAFLLLAGNWYTLLHGWGAHTVLHLWSISVEEQYYLVWPSVCRYFMRGGLGVLSCVLCMACLGFTWVLAATGSSAHNLWLNSAVQSLFFAGGALLALRIGFREQRKSIAASAMYLAGGFAFWYCAEALGSLTTDHHVAGPLRITAAYGLVAVGCGLLLAGMLHIPERLLPAPLLYLGRISYGLYVYHFLVLTVLEDSFGRKLHSFGVLPITLVITTAVAAASYEWLEKPFLKLKSRFELVPTRAA